MKGERSGAFVPPLHDHAFIADGERGALVGPFGDIVWMCFPTWSDDPIFASLHLGPGSYRVAPQGPAVTGGHYEDGTLIFRSRWATCDGIAECDEALARPPPKDGAIVLRRLRAMDHDVRFRIQLALAPRMRARRVSFRRISPEQLEGKVDGVHFRWSGVRNARAVGDLLELDLALRKGRTHDLVLELSTKPFTHALATPEMLWARTRKSWKETLGTLHVSAGARDARLSAAVLHGLTPDGGGLVAAATTSLPERAQSGRSYDYRYTWIRDQCYAGLAASASGLPSLLDRAVAFIVARLHEDGAQLRPVYGARGKRVPVERDLPLPGYPGSVEVRRGNRARSQFQLDCFGEALLLLAEAARVDRLDAQGWRAITACVAAIEKRWHEPDAGVWELSPNHYLHSWLVCVAGLRAVANCFPSRALRRRTLTLADHVLHHATRFGLRSDGAWMRAVGDERSDAALLAPGFRGAFDRGDARTRATIRAVEAELMHDGFVFRFRPDLRPLGSGEGAFLLCQFWLVLAYLAQGRVKDAVHAFERGRGAVGAPGLFTEEFDVEQRQNRGNLPQAFVHAAMLEAAAQLSKRS